MALLAISFIVDSIAVHYWENWFTRLLYFTAGTWLGLGLAILAFSIFAWILILLGKMLGFSLSGQIIGSAVLAAGFALTAYGLWNAGQLTAKTVEIKISGLPSAWQGKSIVQLSDVHLGVVLRPGFIKEIVRRVNQIKPEMVVITGDYYDGMDGEMDDLADPLNELDAPRGVYFITGNHETYLGLEKVYAALAKTKVRVMKNETADVDGLELIGLGNPADFNRGEQPAEILKALKPKRPNILLYHNPALAEKFAATGLVDLMLSGHSHNGQLWPIRYISRLVYGRFVTGLNRVGDFQIYTSPGIGTWGPPIRTGNQPEITVIKLQ